MLNPLALLLPCLLATPAHSAPGPQYSEEADGRLLLWMSESAAAWSTDRAPLPSQTPLGLGLGIGREVGLARLAWRADLLLSGDDLRFLYMDLVSIEQFWEPYAYLRPYWRIAVGFGLDLKGKSLSLGDSGYFNNDNGATGGLGLTHGWGVDWLVTDTVFMRGFGDVKVYGGAGNTGLLWSGGLGVGLVL